MKITMLFFLAIGLSACGVETATTAATVGKLEAEQAKQAQETQKKVIQDLEKMQQTLQQRHDETGAITQQ